MTGSDCAALRLSVNRGATFGARARQTRTAARPGLQSTLRPREWPSKAKQQQPALLSSRSDIRAFG